MTTGKIIAAIAAFAFMCTGIYFIIDNLIDLVSKAINNRKKKTNKEAAVPTRTLIGLRCVQVERCVCITTYGALPVEYVAIRTYAHGEVNIRPLLRHWGEINPEKIYGIFFNCVPAKVLTEIAASIPEEQRRCPDMLDVYTKDIKRLRLEIV